GASSRLGAHYAGGTEEQVEAMDLYGRELGIAFQIVDDCLDLDGDEDIASLGLFAPDARRVHGVLRNLSLSAIGQASCSPAVPNSIGESGRLRTYGTTDASRNRVRLRADRLPPGVTTLFLVSDVLGATPGVGGPGTLCLGGSIGRLNGPGQIMAAGPTGLALLDIDLTRVPRPSGFVEALPGETWHWTAWHRDVA
ncbi:MAG: polyprenyl synthetase family protein, partial [Planctomycetota bacterium]